MTNHPNLVKVDECRDVICTYDSKLSKIDTVLYITNLGLVYKIKSGNIILSPRWSEIKSISHIDLDHILIVWDGHDDLRWKYRIIVKKNARSAMERITQANLEWSKKLNQTEGFTKIMELRGFQNKC